MDYIDLRSDTVTFPTPKMREAMATALVGDDVYGEDPTVNQLEAEAAQLLGKEAGLLIVSGTMGNLVALLTHCGRGDEFIVGRRSHTFVSEQGGAAALGGLHPYTLDVQGDGTLALDDIRRAIRSDDEHHPRSRLITLENTHALSGGNPLTAEYTRQVADIAHENGMKLHVDGARFFNAAAALGVPAKTLAADADSVTFCLSKGLCAPVGSVLVGSKAFIKEARRNRKVLGGGMRQAGILAAAGLIAIRDMSGRLVEDHQNARLLAEGLATIPHICIDVSRVKTNFVFFEMLEDAPLSPLALSERLWNEYNIRMEPYHGERRFRCVTHYYITRERVQQVVEAVRTLLN
jgi:threonine aldolase